MPLLLEGPSVGDSAEETGSNGLVSPRVRVGTEPSHLARDEVPPVSDTLPALAVVALAPHRDLLQYLLQNASVNIATSSYNGNTPAMVTSSSVAATLKVKLACTSRARVYSMIT